ncbi:hypothetical protein GEV33_010894 [Tenebrio molitor]|uniref:Integrase catalytic domain-containing protein n=1 Tax=Tenebrio molitor TaxID=7067 RepID=A0A8J6L9A8_TENMO|nr:hypothetical protein GEV33_010894 [Tenebrio molitor]
MGDLPKQRLEPARPFVKTGIDYIGPILIKEESGRGKLRKTKVYIALFICLVTKAIHLELVGNLTSESFLAALKRFISRRGHVTDLFSDNATNFKGADKELCNFFKSVNFQNVTDALTPCNISWHFIPPRSPTFGGLWEANVKSVERHFKRVVGDTSLNFEEMYTVLARIEACLNSRPLCPASNDPNDLLVLTPGHFLVGEPLMAPVEPILSSLPKNRLSHWRYTEQIRQHFWTRWRKEYLTSLHQRSKWNRPPATVQPGSMVLINEDNLPPQQWLLGRIIQLHPGKDGITRVVSIKTTSGILKRAMNRISILPMDNIHEEADDKVQ